MFPTKILLAIDGSPHSELAARMAADFATKTGSELHVVHVGRVPSAYAAAESEILDYEFWKEMREFAKREVSQSLEDEVRKIEGTGVKVEMAHVSVGRPEVEIVRLAEEIGAGLVVVGSRGHGPLRRAVMGSVSEGVVRHAHGSVLVARGSGHDEGYKPGRILLALDGSKGGSVAERTAVEICTATGAELQIMRVLDTESYRPYPGPEFWEGWEEDLERSERNVRAFLDEHASRLKAEGVKVGEAHLALGEADREIVRFAEDVHAGLIVVGSRGLGGFRRTLLGSVSDSVIRHAHCPVMVVRQRQEREPVARQSEEGSVGP